MSFYLSVFLTFYQTKPSRERRTKLCMSSLHMNQAGSEIELIFCINISFSVHQLAVIQQTIPISRAIQKKMDYPKLILMMR